MKMSLRWNRRSSPRSNRWRSSNAAGKSVRTKLWSSRHRKKPRVRFFFRKNFSIQSFSFRNFIKMLEWISDYFSYGFQWTKMRYYGSESPRWSGKTRNNPLASQRLWRWKAPRRLRENTSSGRILTLKRPRMRLTNFSSILPLPSTRLDSFVTRWGLHSAVSWSIDWWFICWLVYWPIDWLMSKRGSTGP